MGSRKRKRVKKPSKGFFGSKKKRHPVPILTGRMPGFEKTRMKAKFPTAQNEKKKKKTARPTNAWKGK